jgi:Cof subfamily protein (haloacid dehalogenase superfamily)
MCNTKLIALDLDGTLLRSDKTISPRNRNAIRRAVDAGINVILASGRMHSSMAKYAVELEFSPETLIVSYNGALTRTLAGETFFETPLKAEVADFVIDFCREHDLHLNYYLRDVLYTAVKDRWVDVYFSRVGSAATISGDLKQFAGESPTKVLIIDEGSVISRLCPEMQAHFDGSANILITDDEYLEFMSPDASKGRAIERIAEHLGVSRQECLAMGDNNNDLSMIEWAGRGIAMSGGRASLLDRVAEHAPSADDDGVACVIEQLLP